VWFAPGPRPAREGWGGVASLLLRQRVRVRELLLYFWQLMFVGCFTRVHTDTSTCNSSTCPPVETRHPLVMILLRMRWLCSQSLRIVIIAHCLTNSNAIFNVPPIFLEKNVLQHISLLIVSNIAFNSSLVEVLFCDVEDSLSRGMLSN
jgi:hypothetical protein